MTTVQNSHMCCLEDVDMFTIPHGRMKHLLSRASQRAHVTDFTSSVSFCSLLSELSSTFNELKEHEEIENKYIMKILKQKLHGEALKKLLIHLHAHSHISDILNHVQKTEKKFKEGYSADLESDGRSLIKEMQEFLVEYLPHMTEEEQVLQPMLMQFLPIDKLRRMKDQVLQLHHLKELDKKWMSVEFTFQNQFQQLAIGLQPSEPLPVQADEESIESKLLVHDVDEYEKSHIEKLPKEVIMCIFTYLQPKDLTRCSGVSREWNQLAYSGELWRSLHLSNWGSGDWRFGKEMTPEDCNCDCEPNYDFLTFHDYGKNSDKSSEDSDISDESGSTNSSDSEDAMDETVRREMHMLHGFSRYILPKISDSVRTIVLECSKAISNGLLFRMLTKCPNLEFLDVSQTIISDFGLMGLVKVGCQGLQYLDVSGCKNVTDKVLIKLSTAIGRRSKKQNPDGEEQIYDGRQLKVLRLSGCYKITDNGLRALAKSGGLPQLRHLDLSGCFNISVEGIKDLVSQSPKLSMDELYYCDNIAEVSNEVLADASACQNQGCLNRVCCRNEQQS